jgi:hypothetical protein
LHKGTPSDGIVLSAFTADQSKVEPLAVPMSAKAGERIGLAGTTFIPDKEININQYDQIIRHMRVATNGDACYSSQLLLTASGHKLSSKMIGCQFA